MRRVHLFPMCDWPLKVLHLRSNCILPSHLCMLELNARSFRLTIIINFLVGCSSHFWSQKSWLGARPRSMANIRWLAIAILGFMCLVLNKVLGPNKVRKTTWGGRTSTFLYTFLHLCHHIRLNAVNSIAFMAMFHGPVPSPERVARINEMRAFCRLNFIFWSYVHG